MCAQHSRPARLTLSCTTRPAPRLLLWAPPPWPGLEICRFKPDICVYRRKLLRRLQRRAPKRSKLQVRPMSGRCSRLLVGRDLYPAPRLVRGIGVCICCRAADSMPARGDSEIPMADPDDRTRHEGVSPDGRPRRQPPIIDVQAVEVSLDGSRTAAGSGPS